jgi:MFS transporter, OFA family, oxalate/formate antiporter
MKKYFILLASVLIQICIGGLYAWSEFVPALKRSYGLSTAQTQLIFGSLIAVFTLSMVVAGRLLSRFGPRWIAAFGGLAFGGGYCSPPARKEILSGCFWASVSSRALARGSLMSVP